MTYDIAFLLKTIQVMANHIYHTSIFEAGQFCEKGAIYSKHNLHRQETCLFVHFYSILSTWLNWILVG